jgi:SAM-dependent methyltransferase
VLDVGCGTGEHALMAASLGLKATGVDLASAALDRARDKALARGLTVRFLRQDARKLGELGETFDTVLDCGLFHIYGDADRADFVDALRSIVPPRGRYFMLGFSDQQPGDWGPHRLEREQIAEAFAQGWRIDSLEPATIEVTTERDGIRAWLLAATRIDDSPDSASSTPRPRTMLSAEASVETTNPARYLAQFCKHSAAIGEHAPTMFGRHSLAAGAHASGGASGRGEVQLSIECSETSGVVKFTPWGQCTITVDGNTAFLRADATDADALRRIQELVSGDLERWGRRENLKVTWREAAPTPSTVPDSADHPSLK